MPAAIETRALPTPKGRCSLPLGMLLALAACGGENVPATAPSEETVAAAPVAASATRDDVVEAIKCHLAVSGMMAREIVADGPPRRIGPAVRHWHGQIGSRAKAAGMSEAEAEALRKQVVGEQMIEKDTEASRAFGEECYAMAPKA